MAIVAWPAGIRAPTQATLRPASQTQTQRSIFDGSVQTIYQPGAYWVATLVWHNIPLEHWRPLSAFLASLNGMAGRFTYSHPLTWRRASAAAGTPLVAGADQTGASLATDGWTASATVMKAGDWFSYQDAAGRPRLHQVTDDIISGSDGVAALAVAPPLRISPPDNAAIEVDAPEAVWMLASDDTGEVSFVGGNNNKASITVEIMEAPFGSGFAYSGGFVLGSSTLT